jgi:branched-chain amino acid transport system ATP-binding protein
VTRLLDVRHLNVRYNGVTAVRDVSFFVRPGQVTTLLGANGAGKTTILKAICGAVPFAGNIDFLGRAVSNKRPELAARLGIAHVPEGRGTFKGLTVEENLGLGAIQRSDRRAVAHDKKRVLGYFPRLADRASQQAGTLSGGEQQMLAIGRALMLRPKLMLLDEPSFGLSPMMVKEVFDILSRLKKEEQLSIVLVEQNAALASSWPTTRTSFRSGRWRSPVKHMPFARTDASFKLISAGEDRWIYWHNRFLPAFPPARSTRRRRWRSRSSIWRSVT